MDEATTSEGEQRRSNERRGADEQRGADERHRAPWWWDAVTYQIYPRSFADSDGDGIGDLPGATEHLPHLQELGVDAVWLSPFYVSPQHDAGYDVADYRDVDPRFGTLADFDALVSRAHGLGLRVIVDLVPNHTSSDHAWFQAALASAPGSPERARYLFRDGRGPDGSEPPNNWRSSFGGPAWTRVPEAGSGSGQWYLHLYDSSQPDLDWTNPEVRVEFESILRFWLDRDVDGFRVDVAHGLVKAPGLPDWHGPDHTLGLRPEDPRPPMWDQDGVHEIFRQWHELVAGYPGDRILVAESWVDPPARQARYIRPDEMQHAFNFAYLSCPWDPERIRRVASTTLAANDAVGGTTTWVLSNHDVIRHASRLGFPPDHAPGQGIGPQDPQPDALLGLRRARAATLLMLALPGAAYLYQGEELGLPEHTTLPDAARQDPVWFRTYGHRAGRDGCRVPIPWHSDRPAYGFSPTGASWLPQPEVWAALAPDVQQGVPDSTLELYRAALRLRRDRRLGQGRLTWLDFGGSSDMPHENVVTFTIASVHVIANLGKGSLPLPSSAHVLLSSGPLADGTIPADTTVWLDRS